MLIPLLAVSVLSSGSRRPLALVQRHGDARDDRRPGRVPPPMAAQETRARGGRRTATRWRDHLWSYAPRHALTGVVRRPSALMARVPACPHGSPWPESRPRARAACGAVSTRRGTLRPRGGCHAHGHRLWCAGTGVLACVPRVRPQARLALRSAATLGASHRLGGDWRGQRAPGTRACL